jgi:hypothetical protein
MHDFDVAISAFKHIFMSDSELGQCGVASVLAWHISSPQIACKWMLRTINKLCAGVIRL